MAGCFYQVREDRRKPEIGSIITYENGNMGFSGEMLSYPQFYFLNEENKNEKEHAQLIEGILLKVLTTGKKEFKLFPQIPFLVKLRAYYCSKPEQYKNSEGILVCNYDEVLITRTIPITGMEKKFPEYHGIRNQINEQNIIQKVGVNATITRYNVKDNTKFEVVGFIDGEKKENLDLAYLLQNNK